MADFAYHHEAKALVIVLLEDEELSDKLRTSTPNSIHIPVVGEALARRSAGRGGSEGEREVGKEEGRGAAGGGEVGIG
eukprot:365637-Hanusia_phi.AAC.1